MTRSPLPLLLLLPALACQRGPKDPSDTADPARPLRVVLLSDTHVIGPDYTCCSENGDLDNSSIMKSNDRLQAAVEKINAIEPAPDLAFILGDVTHDSYASTELAWFAENENAWSRAADALSQLQMPFYPVWGNHDYEVNCNRPEKSWTRAFTAELEGSFFGFDPYYAVDAGGWRFLVSNAMLGPTWDLDDPRCDTGLASYGPEQLAWMAAQLDEGLPTVWMSHYMLLAITAEDEDPDGPYPDVFSVLDGRDNLELGLVGHAHRWLDMAELHGFPLRIVAATRYDDDNFWVMDLSDDGGFEIVDEDKAVWFTTCADTWTYAGAPALDPTAEETGDCGS